MLKVGNGSTLLMCVVVGWICLATELLVSASPPGGESEPNTGSRLEGKWEVSSASYSTTGPIFYTFRGDTLTIESRQASEKRLGSPQQISITSWKLTIDGTRSPSRLIMTREDETGATKFKTTEAFVFRNGELWMCRDSGDPITVEMLFPGKCAWLTGLTKIK